MNARNPDDSKVEIKVESHKGIGSGAEENRNKKVESTHSW
jgi:hypothetical protein